MGRPPAPMEHHRRVGRANGRKKADGRPRVYCGVPCRRAAEYELRRLQALLALAEKRDLLAREAVVAALFADERSPLRKVAKFWAGEVQRLRGRLLELLGGLGEDAVVA